VRNGTPAWTRCEQYVCAGGNAATRRHWPVPRCVRTRALCWSARSAGGLTDPVRCARPGLIRAVPGSLLILGQIATSPSSSLHPAPNVCRFRRCQRLATAGGGLLRAAARYWLGIARSSAASGASRHPFLWCTSGPPVRRRRSSPALPSCTSAEDGWLGPAEPGRMRPGCAVSRSMRRRR